MSGDILFCFALLWFGLVWFVFPTGGRWEKEGQSTTGTGWVIRDATKYPTLHRTALNPHNKELLLAPNANNTEFEKLALAGLHFGHFALKAYVPLFMHLFS